MNEIDTNIVQLNKSARVII